MELSALAENIINKLRTIADRLWQQGRKIVIVGSTSSDVKKSQQWQNQLADLARDGAHIVPFHASDLNGRRAGQEAMENWRRISPTFETMVKALRPD